MSNTISRLEKLEKESNPYPRNFSDRESISNILYYFHDKNIVYIDHAVPTYSSNHRIAGRIIGRRNHGYNIFFDLMDQTGEIQLHIQHIPTGFPNIDNDSKIPENFLWNKATQCDLGDMVGVEGTLGTSPRGEPLLLVSNWIMLAKALKEPPDKRNGLKSPEMKYRHRELDLMSSKESRDLFKTRARVVAEIRKYLNDRDFIEIECPVLQPIYGGATARPFTTKHNALNQDFFLSISSELYLKRALVGGFDRVYSFSRCFRNEGISPTHNPEFTNLEIFETCKTADDMEDLTENIIYNISSTLNEFCFQSNLLSINWPLSRTLADIKHQSPFNFHKNPKEYADAWELFIDEMEIASGASDLNDPHEQAKRLLESEATATLDINHKNIDYDPYDQNYIEALEQGALPWAGVGIGIDRLIMLLTGKKNIRDVIMFPLLKKEN